MENNLPQGQRHPGAVFKSRASPFYKNELGVTAEYPSTFVSESNATMHSLPLYIDQFRTQFYYSIILLVLILLF